MAYVYRETYRQDENTYIENRGYPYVIERGNEDFEEVDAYFSDMLPIGSTAVHAPNGEWEIVEGFPLFEKAKEKKLKQLKTLWLKAEEDGKAEAIDTNGDSFEIDANPRAMRDITGLILKMKARNITETSYCGADNILHPITLTELENVQLALVDLCQALYEKKWALRSAIEAAQDFDTLEAIHISFED